MNYQQYLQGRNDANADKPRQSLNKDYILGYTETLGDLLVNGDVIQYDWEMPSIFGDPPTIKVLVQAEIIERKSNTIFRVKDISFVHFSDKRYRSGHLASALNFKVNYLVHISQIYRKI